MFSLFSSTKTTNIKDDTQARVDLVSSMVDYSLAYSELMSFCVSLKVKEIVEEANNLSAACQETSASAEETSATTQEISAGIQRVRAGESDNFNRISSLTELAEKANIMLNNMVSNATELVDQIKNIDNISQSVSEIADKTNLLSLNAAIEAARAGENGRGFSVVAEEVRKLADQTKSAVKEVKNISAQMNKKAMGTGDAVSNVKNIFGQYMTDTARVADIMQDNMKQVEHSADAVENISRVAQQQAVTTEGLVSISRNLASTMNFGDIFSGITSRMNNLLKPYLVKPEEKHIISFLAARIVDHSNMLRGTIESAGKELRTISHHECPLGKWYEREYDRYKNIKEFLAIEVLHKQFHEAVGIFSKKRSLINSKGVLDSSRRLMGALLSLTEVI
ncbi:MAG: Methyl-accepting chemotaxis protein 1 [Pelotomaculum sp. PtaU1.Bin035]|nr:MAG: Methyl-accepting chemotaxis protein 1 [Pelotomaculum sp. PtaU1.Bin035]